MQTLPHIVIHPYPKIHDGRELYQVDDFLIALYLNRAYKWRLSECVTQTHFYTIELFEGIGEALEENQGILSVGMDTYIITEL